MKRLLSDMRMLVLLDQALVSGCNFIMLLFVTRIMSVDEFGTFTLAMLATVFLSNMHRALLTQPLNVLGATERTPRRLRRLALLLRAHLITIPAGIVILGVLAWQFFPDVALFAAAALYIGCFHLQETFRRYWYTVARIDRAFTADIVVYIGQFLLIVSASRFMAIHGTTVFLAMACASLIAFAWNAARIDFKEMDRRLAAGQTCREHWKMSRWLVPTVLMVWGASQLYPFFLAAIGPAFVAVFMACRNLLNAMNIIIQSIESYLPVRAAAVLGTGGRHALLAHLLRTVARAGIGAGAFAALILVVAEPLLHFLYAGRYDNAAPLLRILAAGTFFAVIGAVLGAYSLAMEDARASFLANLGASAFSFSVGFWLVQRYGPAGAATAGVLSAATAAAIQAAFVYLRINSFAVRHAART